MSNKKILIVEDDPDVRKGLGLRLQANHYDTCFAGDGVAAMAEARKQQPDLVLLDLGMPAGDGFTVMQWFRASPFMSVVPVIVVSARTGEETRKRALGAGATAFLEKPVDNDELLAVIRTALAGSLVFPKL